MTPARRALLLAALGFLELQWGYKPTPVDALERWLHTWRGVGDVVTGMSAQGFDLELRAFGDHWRATFYPVGLAHSIVVGTACEPTPRASGPAGGVFGLNDPRTAGVGDPA